MGRALVVGCGGTLGFAWTAAVLAELERLMMEVNVHGVLHGLRRVLPSAVGTGLLPVGMVHQ